MKKLLVIQNIETEGPGLFSKIAAQKGFRCEIYKLSKGDHLPIPRKEDLILIMGGPMGVRDINNKTYYWLKKEVQFITEAIENKFPIIGVCLGAQLLAHIMGGKIVKLKNKTNNKYKPEIGWSEISSIKCSYNNNLSLFLKRPLNVLHWHSDRIILPKKSHLIASSDYCREQLFILGKKLYGLQFHAETEGLMTNNWINKDKNFIIDALGEKGQTILKDECNKYELSSLKRRLLFIDKLIDNIIEH